MNKLTKKLSTLILSSAVLFGGTHINAKIFENNREYDLGEFGKVVITKYSIKKKFIECFDVKNFRCEITIYENSYSINFIDMRSGCEFWRRWMIEDKCKITPELILTDIIQEISCHTNSVIQPKITKTRQKINLLAKEDKRKEETKPKKDFCQCDTNYGHNHINQTFKDGKLRNFYQCKQCLKPKHQDTITKVCNWRAYCKECEDIESFFMAKRTGEKYVLNCCGCWPFSNSIEKGSRLEFANQKAFNEAINKKTVKYYCTECKKEMEPSDVIFVPTGRKKQSVKCRICQNKAKRDCLDKQKAEK